MNIIFKLQDRWVLQVYCYVIYLYGVKMIIILKNEFYFGKMESDEI